MNAISKLNLLRRRFFGYSAPVATAAATIGILGWAVPTVTQYVRGAPVLFSMKVIIGATVAVVVLTEAGFYFFGTDADVIAADNARQMGVIGAKILADKDLRATYMKAWDKSEVETLSFAQKLVDAVHDAEKAAKADAKVVMVEAKAEGEAEAEEAKAPKAVSKAAKS